MSGIMRRSLAITVILASSLLAAGCDDTKAYRSVDPVPGEVTIVLLDLPMGVTSRHGEATLVIGPNGSLGLIDIGNSNHDDQLRDVIRFVNQERLTSERGFETRDALQVEWLLLTHYHGDHIGAFDDLVIDTDELLSGVLAVVHRGFIDLGDGMNEDDFEALCDGLRGDDALSSSGLCVAEEEAPCQARDRSHPFRATSCPGLFAGDLFDSDDNSDHEVAFIPLGGSARLTIVAANTFVAGSDGEAHPMEPFGHDDNNQENARSIVAQLSFGGFRYQLGGDLTGSGDSTEPDVESHVLEHAGESRFGVLGVDVIHAHHHGRRTSSNSAWVEALAPVDGRTRNVVAGINAAHLGSPHDEVVARWTENGRLGEGHFYATHTPSGASPDDYSALVDADGPVIIQTEDGGRAYRIWSGPTGWSMRFETVR